MRAVTVLFAEGFQFAIHAEVEKGKPIEGNAGGFLDDKLFAIAKRLEKQAFAKSKEKGGK